MNLHNDLLRAEIPHDCTQCFHRCPQRKRACEDFRPINDVRFMDYAVAYLKEDLEEASDMYMPKSSHESEESKFYTYYAMLVNDALRAIRRGKEEYVYTFEQIRDIMRYEPHIEVRCDMDSGAYCVKLEK